jgi:hypothetical protein
MIFFNGRLFPPRFVKKLYFQPMRILQALCYIFILMFLSCKKSDEIRVHDFVLANKSCVLNKVSEINIIETKDKFIGEILWSRVKFGKIFVSDRTQHIIVVLNREGLIERFVGEKKGWGPGEIREIMDFDVGEDGLIYIFDMGNMRFSIFDTSGKFVNLFKFKSEDKLVGPIRKIRVNNGWIYAGVIESRFYNQSDLYKSRRVAIIDTQGNVLRLFGNSDEIFKKFKVHPVQILLDFDSFGNIYIAQHGGTYKIYKYDKDYKLVKIFGVQGKFRPLSEDIPWNLPIHKINELYLKFSDASLLRVVDSIICFQYVNLTKEGIQKRNPFYHRYYLKVYDLDGNYIPSDIELPGRILDVDEDGNIYIYESNEPGKRRIGVYRLRIRDN